MKILIIESQELVLLSLTNCLTKLGYQVYGSKTVENAIELYNLERPDLVISDIKINISNSKKK